MLNVTLTVPPGQEATPVYEAVGGIPVTFSGRYWDGDGLHVPLPIVDAGGPTYVVSDGSLQSALPVTGLGNAPPLEQDAVTDNGITVTNNGETVTNA